VRRRGGLSLKSCFGFDIFHVGFAVSIRENSKICHAFIGSPLTRDRCHMRAPSRVRVVESYWRHVAMTEGLFDHFVGAGEQRRRDSPTWLRNVNFPDISLQCSMLTWPPAKSGIDEHARATSEDRRNCRSDGWQYGLVLQQLVCAFAYAMRRSSWMHFQGRSSAISHAPRTLPMSHVPNTTISSSWETAAHAYPKVVALRPTRCRSSVGVKPVVFWSSTRFPLRPKTRNLRVNEYTP